MHEPGEFPFEIEQALLAACERAAGQGTITLLDFEPREWSGRDLPAASLFWVQAIDEDHQTGPATQVTWGWNVRLYCDLSVGYDDAQRQLRTWVPMLLLAVRRDPSLDGTCEQGSLSDPGGEPELSHAEGLIWKSLRFTCVTEETS